MLGRALPDRASARLMIMSARDARGPGKTDHFSPQWLRRLISTVRSPSKMCLSSWFTP